MGMIIRDSVTWHNINRLRDHVFDSQADLCKIAFLIDCNTGEINIPKAIADLESLMHAPQVKEHRLLKHLELLADPSLKGTRFTIRESDFGMKLRPSAARVLEEMIDILNRVGADASSLQETLNLCMRSVKMAIKSEIEHFPGWWGQIDRIEAEKCLIKEPVGTYMLREGEKETKKIEDSLQKTAPFSIRCYVMTIVEEERKISDKLLIQAASGWTLYNDDPRLDGYFYNSLPKILEAGGALRPLKKMKRVA